MFISEETIIVRVLIATFLSGLIGFEREHTGHSAGLRTHMLIGLASAMFTAVGVAAFDPAHGDLTRVPSQIVTGVTFLSGGMIVFHRGKVKALTTSAGIWVVAAVGMAIGFGYYKVGIAASLIAILVLRALYPVGKLVSTDDDD
jgi:putative Mg2+ transporter-C (MgtC) family protein